MKEFLVNPTSEFHVLRHFKTVLAEHAASLIGQEYYYFDHGTDKFVKDIITETDIQKALKTLGSKFDLSETELQNPRELLEYCREKLIQSGVSLTDKVGINKVHKLSFAVPVGDIDFIELSKLSKSEKAEIIKQPRGQTKGESVVMVNTLAGKKKQKTSSIAVEILEAQDLPFLWVICYPAGPKPFEIDESKDFWE